MTTEANSPSALRRVYVVAWWFADFGGMERHIVELAKALHRRGIAVTVFSEMPVSGGNQYRKELRQAGVAFVSPWISRSLVLWWQRRFPAKPSEPDPESPVRSQAFGGSFLARLLKSKLERRVKRETPDVIHVHGWLLSQWVITWCAANGIPCVYTEHSTISDWGGPALADAPDSISSAGDIACVSESACRSLAHWLPGRGIAIHRHIVPLPQLLPNSTVSRPPRVLCVARLRAEKGLDVLLRAASELRRRGLPFHLELVGDGPQLSELRALSRGLGLDQRQLFSGSFSAHAIQEKMQHADIFVLPSRTEAMPLALLEAMSHGLAIVATRVGGIPEVVLDGETGLLVEPGSVESLADAIGKVLSDAGFRETLGQNAREHFTSGSYSEVAAIRGVLDSYELAQSGVCSE